ncbi:PH domain-containing protein [Buchananella felis]|uniref:PH domain-containing protein n=1 Tax=Buchananella felis TaxID=3231492 RepID=UPI0035297665
MSAPMMPDVPPAPPTAAPLSFAGEVKGEVGTVMLERGPEQVIWRRVHGVTPIVRSWQAVVALAAVLFAVFVELMSDFRSTGFFGTLAGVVEDYTLHALGGAGLLLGLVALGFFLQWRAIRYTVSSDGVHLNTGVLMKQQRVLRLTRIQTVDITRPLLGRILGLGELTVEAAGGADSSVKIGFLPERELNELRAEVLARAAGVKVGQGVGLAQPVAPGAPTQFVPAAQPGQVGAAGTAASAMAMPAAGPAIAVAPPAAQTGAHPVAPAPHGQQTAPAALSGFQGGQRVDMSMEARRSPVAPERLIYRVPPSNLIGALMRNLAVWVAALALLGVVTATLVLTALGHIEVLLAGPAYLLPMVIAFAGFLWQRFAGEYNFRAALSADGVRIHRGLTQTVAQTIPPGRIQAVTLTQPLLWRGKDWWRVTVQVAGQSRQDGNNQKLENDITLLPVGSREEALYALWLAVPELGLLPGESPAEVLAAGLTGQGEAAGFVVSPRGARWFNPIEFRRLGVRLAERTTLYRSGRIRRSLQVVPHVRLQGVTAKAGPLDRAAGVACLTLAVANTAPVRVQHVEAGYAAYLQENLVRLSREDRHREAPEQWMTRVGVEVPAAPAPGGVPAPVPVGGGGAASASVGVAGASVAPVGVPGAPVAPAGPGQGAVQFGGGGWNVGHQEPGQGAAQ